MLNRSFADNLFRNRLRTFGEVVELHGELTSALSSRTKFGRVTEHFGKRNERIDNLGTVSVFGAEDCTSSRRNVTLIKTLQTYLDHNQSTKKTADTMYVNYRTITYRLDKIKDITGIDFDNSGEMLAIRNGLMILKLANKLN